MYRLAARGEMLPPCGVPVSLRVHVPSSSTPAANHWRISRTTRLSPIRCSTNRMSQSCSSDPKKSRRSASSTHFTRLLSIAWSRALSAWCALRPGLAPYEKPANSGSYTSLRTSTVALWTILSSTVVMPIGRCCLASPRLGMYTRRTGSGRYGPRRTCSDSLGEVRLQLLAIVFPRLAVHAWCRITFQLVERRPERVDGVDVV